MTETTQPWHPSHKTALITGAGQGVGRAIALALVQRGIGSIAVNDFQADRAIAVAEEIKAAGVNALAVPGDVGDYAAMAAAIRQVEEHCGPIGILVNNAGNAGPEAAMGRPPLFWETAPGDWEKFFHTNLNGVLNCCHLTLPGMIRQNGGRIITITSDAGRVGEARLSVYSAAKAGTAGFMRSLAKETGRYNITCNCISLSMLEPNLPEPEKSRFLAGDQARALLSRYSIRRFGRPEDAWITGQVYPVNGGYDAAR
ncbi:MAG: oxidoreductase [Pseudomonadales bacterium]|nr:oxidoreductase [Pseudomonadales bacterium]